MGQRGLTLLELLVAAFVGSIILLGIGSFYVKSQAAVQQGNYQAAIQRQAILVQQEMARIILPSSGLLPGTCGPVSAVASLPAQIPANAVLDDALSGGGFVCFYLQSSQISECRFVSSSNRACINGSSRSLLTGPAIQEPIQAGIPQNMPAGMTMFNSVGGAAVDVNFDFGIRCSSDPSFHLTACLVGPFSFGTRVAIRN